MFIASFNPHNYPIGSTSSSQVRDKNAAQCYTADKCHRLDINPDPPNKKPVTQLLG